MAQHLPNSNTEFVGNTTELPDSLFQSRVELQKLGRRELIEMILSNNAFILQHLLNGRSDSYSDVLMQQIVYNAYTAHVQGYSIMEDDEVFYF